MLAQRRVLFLVSAFNGLSQAVYSRFAPQAKASKLLVGVKLEAALAFKPDLVLCPFLLDYLPPELFVSTPCLVFHPGPADRGGPSSLAWAVLRGEQAFGAAVFAANAAWDQGPLWAQCNLTLQPGSLAWNYRRLMVPAALELTQQALSRLNQGQPPLQRPAGRYEPQLKDADLAFSWEEPSNGILQKIWAGDNQPGAKTWFQGQECRCYAAQLG